MKKQYVSWGKTLSILVALAFFSIILPEAPLTNFVEISLKKIVQIMLAVSAIQVIGIFTAKKFNSHAGVILHGFVSGIVSSTVFTLNLAKESKKQDQDSVSVASLGFLSATLAMLTQGFVLLWLILPFFPSTSLALFIIPMLVTGVLMVKRTIHTQQRTFDSKRLSIDWFIVVKMAFFIVFILTLSHLIKKYFGEWGVAFLTFTVSLFELHGMLVATAQMLNSNTANEVLFNKLLFLTLFAGYISKMGLVYWFGSKYLIKKIFIWSFWILLSIYISWIFFG